jgi:Zn-finger nucleic acid-binding protein
MNSKLKCTSANCSQPLTETQSNWGTILSCSSCKGRAVKLSALKKIASPEAAEKLWRDSIKTHRVGSRFCPGCKRPMKIVRTETKHGAIELDVCNPCLLIWFDSMELEHLIPAFCRKPDKLGSHPPDGSPSALDLYPDQAIRDNLILDLIEFLFRF